MRESGFRVFGLHPIKDGHCTCDKGEDCTAAGKHPVATSWQHTPDWSDEQIECMEESGQFDTGYGVLCEGYLIVDVDARNGGMESYAQLCDDCPEVTGAGMIVNTGSGGGSKHLYFKAPAGTALVTHLRDYPGIDFKSSGFVVGPGSQHASGGVYSVAFGSPDDVDSAPQALLDALKKPDTFRADVRGAPADVSSSDIASMLAHVDPDCDHDIWIRCGMAVHDATQGTGFDLWDRWSKDGSKYPGRDALERRWHSFGKSTSPTTLGTLWHYAEEGGWSQPVTFDDDTTWETPELSLDVSDIDLLRPPGLVGELTDWINGNCRFPRERLAVAAALTTMGNVAGLRSIDKLDGVTMNLFTFCVAGSGTGKEAVLQSATEIHRAAGIHLAVHGSIKSEQEIIRNLTRHQAAFYLIDELGFLLGKIKNAQQKGSAAYLEAIPGALMSAYSKADGYLLLTGDTKEEVRKELARELAQSRKAVAENEDRTGAIAARIPSIERALDHVDNGLERPFLSVMGMTTPVTFDHLVTAEAASNGFIGRAIIMVEPETNPRPRRGYKGKTPLPQQLAMRLSAIASGGSAGGRCTRVEHYGPRHEVPTADDAREFLHMAQEWFLDYAEQHKELSGLEAIPRRSYEMCSKISAVLAVGDGLRTLEHVRWGFAMAKADCDAKLRLAYANENDKSNPGSALAARVLGLLGTDTGCTVAYLANRTRRKKSDIEKAIKALEKNGEVVQKSGPRGAVRWFAC